MFKRKFLAALLAVSMLSSTVPVYAAPSVKANVVQQNTQWDDVSSILDEHLGVYTKPSPIPDDTGQAPDGPLMGNGTVFAFLGGGTKNQKIYVSKADNWEDCGAPIDVHYVTFGGIEIQAKTNPNEVKSEFRYEQDMKNAEVYGRSEMGYESRSWLSAKENIIVTEIKNLTDDVMPFDVMTSVTHTGSAVDTTGVDEENGVVYATKEAKSSLYNWSVNSTIATTVLDKDIEVKRSKVDAYTSKTQFELEPGATITLVSAVEGGKESTTNKEDAITKALSKDTAEKLQTAKEAHRQWWKDYWLKSYINIDSSLDSWEKVYYGNLYLSGCCLEAQSENNAGLTIGLFPWTASTWPNWQADYTLNTDIQRSIHTMVSTNRYDLIDNYYNVIDQFWEEGRKMASDANELNRLVSNPGHGGFTSGIRGVLFPTHIGPWGSRTEHFRDARDCFNSPSNASMVLQPLVKYYRATLDDEFLKEKLYSKVKDVAHFWEDYVVLDPDGTRYDVYGATLENTHGGDKNAIMDLLAAKYTLKNAIEFSEYLDVDAEDREKWQYLLEHLSPNPTAVQNGKEVYCMYEGAGAPGIRDNCAIIQGFYFFDMLGLTSSKEELQPAINYLEECQDWVNLKANRAGIIAARVGYDPDIYFTELGKSCLDSPVANSTGLRDNNDVGGPGNATILMGVVTDSLLQSHEGFINIFPNWFEDKEAEFVNLSAFHAFTVSAKRNTFAQTTEASVYSAKGEDCAVLNPWPGQKMKVFENGKEVTTETTENVLGDVYHFQTKAGSTYELKPEGQLPEAVAIDREEVEMLPGEAVTLNARTTSEDTFVWSSEDESIATIEDGVVTAHKKGDVVVRVALAGNEEVYDTCVIHVVNEMKIPSEQLSAVADSEENSGGDGPAANAVDGDKGTIWHSGYSAGKIKPDIPNNINNTITIDLGGNYPVNKLEYVPRSGSDNGIILKYELWASEEAEGENFTKISEGSWQANKDIKTARFAPVNARRIRIRAMETMGNNQFISAAECYVYKSKDYFVLDKSEAEMHAGEKMQLKTYTDMENPSVQWTSDNPEVAVVGKDGIVTALNSGTAVITATVSDAIKVSCTITVMQEKYNCAGDAYITANSNHDNYVPQNVVDGRWGGNGGDSSTYAWVSGIAAPNAERWLKFDFGEKKTINSWDIRLIEGQFSNASGKELVTDFTLQSSNDGNNWETVKSFKDNTETYIAQEFEKSVTARYFRIHITKAFSHDPGNGFARVDEVQFFSESKNAEEIHVAEVEAVEGVGVSTGTAFDKLALPKEVSVKLSNDAYANIPVEWEQGDYNEAVVGRYTLTGNLVLPESIANPEHLTVQIEVQVVSNEEANKEELAGLIEYAESQKTNEDYKYVIPVVKEAFEKALADAVAVNENEAATQAQVDAAYDKLLTMVHYLDFAGNSESLKVLVDAAKGFNEKLYTADSWAVLKDALVKAEAVLADENALQNEIDAAAEELQAAMDALVKNPVDKAKLQKLVDKSKKYEDKIAEYTEATANIFTGALENARNILAKEDATQEEVDAAYAALNNAIFGLRLIPNKDKLEDLINSAKKVDVTKYTAETAAAFTDALAKAEVVFADENATADDVKAAEKALKKAQKNLVAKADAEVDADKKDDDKKTDDKVASTDGNNKPADKAAKTGDVNAAVPAAVTGIAALAVLMALKKRR